MNCSATLDCGELVCFLFVLCHSQDNPPALCQEMEKGISGCSTLTKLSLHCLPLQCSSASVRAAMAHQSSLTEVEWSYCDSYGKSDIGVLCLCAVCGVCIVRDKRKRSFGAFVRPWCALVHVCVYVVDVYLHCVCPSLVNVATSCVGA